MVKDNDAGGAGGQGNPYKIVSSSVLEEGGKPATGNANRVHPSFYIGTWMVLSSTIILFNKYILDKGGFPFPILLTTWHLVFATGATRILRKTTGLLDGIDAIQMDWTTWFKAVVPIGALFSATLILSNMAYLYLSVSFIQMLKATTPVAVLLMSWCAGTEKPNLDVFWKVSIIVFGVILATYGEFDFVFIGFVVQCLGILFEAGRLVLVQKLLHAYKMDPLCSLYYFAPVCAAMNFAVFLVVEAPRVNAEAFVTIGYGTLLANASVAFALNCAVVFLIGKTSSLVMCLSGIVKDIILVCASSLIWGNKVGSLQVLGYAIALVGLVWYKQVQLFSATKLREVLSRTRVWVAILAGLAMVLLVGAVFQLDGVAALQRYRDE